MLETIEKVLKKFFDSKNISLDLYQISGNKIKKMLIKHNEKIYLIDRRCPHNGLPLSSASFIKNYVTCRWHGCRFSFIPDASLPKENVIKSVIINKEDTSWINDELQN